MGPVLLVPPPRPLPCGLVTLSTGALARPAPRNLLSLSPRECTSWMLWSYLVPEFYFSPTFPLHCQII